MNLRTSLGPFFISSGSFSASSFFARSIWRLRTVLWYSIIFLEKVMMILCFRRPVAFTFLARPFLSVFSSYSPRSTARSAEITLYAKSLYRPRLFSSYRSKSFISQIFTQLSLESRRYSKSLNTAFFSVSLSFLMDCVTMKALPPMLLNLRML